MPSASLAATLGALLTVTFKKPPAAEDSPKSLIEDPLTMERVGFRGILDDKFHPPSLSAESATLLRSFIRTLRNLPDAEKAKFIQDGTVEGAGRQAYKSWFKSICGDFNRNVEMAMSETGYHPLQLLQTRIDDDYFDVSSTASAALTDVAVSLFGPIVLDGSDVLVDSNLTGYMKTLLVFNYQRMGRHRNRSKKEIDSSVEAMDEAMKPVNESNPPKMSDVRVAIRACKVVISLAIWFPELLTRAEENMAFLDGFVRRNAKVPEGLDPHVVSQKPGAEERIARARERGYNIKACDADISDAYQIKQTLLALVTYLEEVHAADGNPHIEDLEDISPDELFSEDGDMGVDMWKSKSPEELQSLLLFPDGRPKNWNAYSSVGGATCWDKEVDPVPFQEGGPGFNPIALHWHQLAGVCSSTHKMFTAEPTDNVPGTILADGVGVGKTAQIMGTIAFLQQVFVSEQAEGRSRPPLIANRPYFMGRGPVPDAPHLIVVPLSLMAQWHRELRTFFKDGAVDIFRLPLATGDVRKFFNHPKGAWKRSQQDMHKRIVICAHSTFTTLTSKSFNCARGAASVPVDRRRPRKPDSINTGTIFDIEWCSTTIDEGHLFRGPTRGFVGACQLRLHKKTWVLNLATATPLYTQFRDVFNLARMIGLLEFCLTEGLLWEKTLSRRIQATKRSLSQAERDALHTRTLRQMTGEATDNSAANKIRETNYTVVKEIQRALGHHIIRRTLESKQYDGTSLNHKMPPVTSHTIFVKLTERELSNLQLIVDGISGGLVPSDLHLEHFWLKYRIGVIFFNIFGDDWPELIDGLINGIPYSECFSSKLQECIRLVKHLLSHDGVEHAYWTEEDGLVCPEVPAGTEIQQTRKVLVFYEFTMMTPTIVSVFRHFGLNPYVLNSTLNDREREAVVSSFVNGTDPARRVLLFSAVGAVGLNLTCADVIIMLDTQWSQVGVEQIIGRCARLTQEKPVHIYYLLALQTTDVLMVTLAREKGEMLNTLLNRGRNEELEKLLKGVNLKDLGNDDVVDIDPTTGSTLPSKPAKRPRKSAASKALTNQATPSSSSTPPHPSTPVASSSASTVSGSGTSKGKKKGTTVKAKPATATKGKGKPKGKGKITSPEYVPSSDDETPSPSLSVPPTTASTTTSPPPPPPPPSSSAPPRSTSGAAINVRVPPAATRHSSTLAAVPTPHPPPAGPTPAPPPTAAVSPPPPPPPPRPAAAPSDAAVAPDPAGRPSSSSSETPTIPPRVSDSPAPDSEEEYDFEGPLGFVIPPTPSKPASEASRPSKSSISAVLDSTPVIPPLSTTSTLVNYDSSDTEMASPTSPSQQVPDPSSSPSPSRTDRLVATLPRSTVPATRLSASSPIPAVPRSVTPPTRRQKMSQPESPQMTPSSSLRHRSKRTKTSIPPVISAPASEPSPVLAAPPSTAPSQVADPSGLFDDDHNVEFASTSIRGHQTLQNTPERPRIARLRLPTSSSSSSHHASPIPTATQRMENDEADDEDPFHPGQASTPASRSEDNDSEDDAEYRIPRRQHLPSSATARLEDRVVDMRLSSFRGRIQAPPRRTYAAKRGRK